MSKKEMLLQLLSKLSEEDIASILESSTKEEEEEEVAIITEIEQPKRRKQSRGTKVEQTKKVGGRTQRRVQKGEKNKVKAPVQCRQEAIATGPRPNLFEAMPDKKACKNDVLIDKALIGNNQPTLRRPKAKLIEVECTECGEWYEVYPHEVYMDDDGVQFICNECR